MHISYFVYICIWSKSDKPMSNLFILHILVNLLLAKDWDMIIFLSYCIDFFSQNKVLINIHVYAIELICIVFILY